MNTVDLMGMHKAVFIIKEQTKEWDSFPAILKNLFMLSNYSKGLKY